MSVAHIIHLKKDVCAFNFHALGDSNLRTTCLQWRRSPISIFSTHCAEFQLRAHTRFVLYAAGTRSEEPRKRLCIVCVCARPLFCIIARVCALHERLYYIKICACSQRVGVRLHTSAWAQFERGRLIKKLCCRNHNGEGGAKTKANGANCVFLVHL